MKRLNSYMKQKFDNTREALSLIRFSKKVIVFCLIFVTLYTTVAILYQFINGDEISTVLTERVFTTMIGELAITGVLKVAEGIIKALSNKDDDEENEKDFDADELLSSMTNESEYVLKSNMEENDEDYVVDTFDGESEP